MSSDVSGADLARLFAEGLAQIGVAMEPLTEAVEGYRARCERNGYSDAVSRAIPLLPGMEEDLSVIEPIRHRKSG